LNFTADYNLSHSGGTSYMRAELSGTLSGSEPDAIEGQACGT
jgi:hypothetical protein